MQPSPRNLRRTHVRILPYGIRRGAWIFHANDSDIIHVATQKRGRAMGRRDIEEGVRDAEDEQQRDGEE